MVQYVVTTGGSDSGRLPPALDLPTGLALAICNFAWSVSRTVGGVGCVPVAFAHEAALELARLGLGPRFRSPHDCPGSESDKQEKNANRDLPEPHVVTSEMRERGPSMHSIPPPGRGLSRICSDLFRIPIRSRLAVPAAPEPGHFQKRACDIRRNPRRCINLTIF